MHDQVQQRCRDEVKSSAAKILSSKLGLVCSSLNWRNLRLGYNFELHLTRHSLNAIERRQRSCLLDLSQLAPHNLSIV